jgi:hypothetical protein
MFVCNPSTGEVEAGGSQVQGYTARSHFRKKKKLMKYYGGIEAKR